MCIKSNVNGRLGGGEGGGGGGVVSPPPSTSARPSQPLSGRVVCVAAADKAQGQGARLVSLFFRIATPLYTYYYYYTTIRLDTAPTRPGLVSS